MLALSLRQNQSLGLARQSGVVGRDELALGFDVTPRVQIEFAAIGSKLKQEARHPL